MIKIIILIFLTREIGRLARSKGLKPAIWKIYNVLGWLTFECIGLLIGLMIFGKNNLISVNLIGIAFAVTSYFLMKSRLNKLPDHHVE